MSWTLHASGTAEAVKEQIASWDRRLDAQHIDAAPDAQDGQVRQMTTVRNALLYVIRSLSGVHSVSCTAEGHHDGDAHSDTGTFSLQITYQVPDGTLKDPVTGWDFRPPNMDDKQYHEELSRIVQMEPTHGHLDAIHSTMQVLKERILLAEEQERQRLELEEQHAKRRTFVRKAKAPESEVTEGQPIPSVDEQ